MTAAYYRRSAPATEFCVKGDVWYDISDDYQLYQFDGVKWVKKTGSHFRLPGYYCKSPIPHEGPCPMVITFVGKIRYFIAKKRWPKW